MLRRDLTNLVALTGVQAANALLPLLVFPHLLRTAGQERYTWVVLAEVVALAVLTLALYSFDVDALKRVVGLDVRRDAPAVSKAFSDVLVTRLVVFVPSAALALAGCHLLRDELMPALAWWLLLPLGQLLQSAWLFQGLEHNVPIAATTLTSRVSSIVLILALVEGPPDYLLVPALLGASSLLGALALLAYAHHRLGLRLCSVSATTILGQLRAGSRVFLGNVSVFLYRDANAMLLAVAGASAPGVATYSLAEKLIKGFQAAARPLNQLFFPKALRALGSMRVPDRRSLWTLVRLTAPQWLALLGVLAALLGLAAVLDATGNAGTAWSGLPDRSTIVMLLSLMAPAVFFGVANFMLGTIGLNHLGAQTHLLRALLAVGVSNLVLCLALASAFGALGGALAFVLSEAVLCASIVSRYFKERAANGRANGPV